MKRILLVDDGFSGAGQIALFLEADYCLFQMPPGEAALRCCIAEKPDLVLMDTESTGIENGTAGFELLYRLKQTPFLERIPVLLLKPKRDTEAEAKELALGARDFIIKPVIKSVLLHKAAMYIQFMAYREATEKNVAALTGGITAAFAELIENRGDMGGGHVVRTARYIDILGQELIRRELFTNELTWQELCMMVEAAPLHDIGKVAISDRILLKAGRLDDEEFTAIKRHALTGAEILSRMYRNSPSLQYLRYAALIAESHHERFDGKGYPHGLVGDDIPLPGRLMAVADVYDALLEHRSYRSGIGHVRACSIIQEGKGAHFDPRIVDAFDAAQNQFYEIADNAGEEN